jgi:hypothetical protein
MEILGRNPTPDKYAIQEIEVVFQYTGHSYSVDPETKKEIEGTRKPYYAPYLLVSLEPEGYLRDRGFGSSYETKKNPCRLKIPFDEFQRLQQAMSHKLEVMKEELKDCYQFLHENDLMTTFEKRKEEREDEAEIARLEMKIAAKKAAKAAEESKQENPSSSVP